MDTLIDIVEAVLISRTTSIHKLFTRARCDVIIISIGGLGGVRAGGAPVQ